MSSGKTIGMRIGAMLLVAGAVAGGGALIGARAPERLNTAPKASPTARPTPHPTPTATPTPTPVDAAYVVKSILPIDGPMRLGDYVWDDDGVAQGEVIITVDLAAQTLSVFRDGHEIGASTILYGADAKPTPLGVFPITQKDADHRSSIYDGAPMPYMLRLTNDGVSIHGSAVADGYMTHGCIGVPVAFAKKMFGAVKLGDRVIVTRGKMLDRGEAITAA